MEYLRYNNIWDREFDNTVSTKDKVPYINFYQLKLKVIDFHKKDEKTATNFQPIYDEDV